VIIQKQREWILQSFPLKKSQVYPVRIFLSRRASYRNLLNIEAVSRLLRRYEFQVVEPDESFYLNQARFFSEVNTVFSPGGAVLANIIFMQKGSKVVSIRSWRGTDVPLWKLLSYACEVNHSEVVGIPTYFGFKLLARQHSNFFVPLGCIKKSLNI
jgi:capsular polysaccharide biosynthesis protein